MRAKPKCLKIAALSFWSVAILFSMLQTVSGQGFVNLNFEQASIQSAPPDYTPSDANPPISAVAALPDWTVLEDGIVCNAIWGAPNALDETSVALVSGGSYPNYTPLQGRYSVQLSAYADAPSGLFTNSSISQTGLIPIGTQSIQFLIFSPTVAGGIPPNPTVTLNGTAINTIPISTSGGIITMVGNISAFAGTTATLAFLCQATQGGGFPANENYFALDNIQFSPSAVPEPNELALSALGALLLGFRRWQK